MVFFGYTMRVGLIDIDSKIPNLALMKWSAYAKKEGYDVELTAPIFADQYDIVIASKVFDFTPMPILPDRAVVGGTGFDLKKKLPEEAEGLYPDYSLYDCDYAVGFTTRGCNRRCPFCIVPKAEGKFRVVGDIYNFWDGQEKLMLLDNSLNTDEDHFLMICDQLTRNKIKTDFSQGLDIRYLTDVQAMALKKVPLWKQIHFAWDSMSTERAVEKGIHILERYNLRHKSMFYVLIGYDTTQDEDLYRVNMLKGWGVDPFVMPYNKFDNYQRNFARWVNHKAIFKSVPWKEYRV